MSGTCANGADLTDDGTDNYATRTRSTDDMLRLQPFSHKDSAVSKASNRDAQLVIVVVLSGACSEPGRAKEGWPWVPVHPS
jgi:hypothetical protein